MKTKPLSLKTLKKHTPYIVLIPLALSLMMCAGDDAQGQLGIEGLLTFAFISTDGDLSVKRPIATGATARMLIGDADKDGYVECLEEISASAPSIIEPWIVARRGDEIVVKGLSEGQSLIELAAIVGEDKTYVVDKIQVSVATADTYQISHRCPNAGNDQVGYVVGVPAKLSYARFAKEQRLRGAGACGAETRPMPSQISCDDNSITIGGSAQEGVVEVDVQGQTKIVTLNFVQADRVIIAQKEQIFAIDERVRLELELQTIVWPVCSELIVNAEILTPEICTFWTDNTIYSEGSVSETFTYVPGQSLPVSVDGLQEGGCTISLSSPQLLGSSWQYTTPVYTAL